MCESLFLIWRFFFRYDLPHLLFVYFIFLEENVNALTQETVWDFSVAICKVSKSSVYTYFQLVFLILASLPHSYSEPDY